MPRVVISRIGCVIQAFVKIQKRVKSAMKAFLVAIIVAVGMGVVAASVLEGGQLSVSQKYSTSNVRN
jgi:uncharacterized membrane protein YoaK (UPF0700 family)